MAASASSGADSDDATEHLEIAGLAGIGSDADPGFGLRGPPTPDTRENSSRQPLLVPTAETGVGSAVEVEASFLRPHANSRTATAKMEQRAAAVVTCPLTVGRSAASRASAASGPSESEGGESAATPC